MDYAGFEVVLGRLGWTKGDLCGRLGLHRNTPSRWQASDSVPRYVSEYLRVCVCLHDGLSGG